ncbi:hypothetical protein EJB05_00366, partial [Eragrostis curvula]
MRRRRRHRNKKKAGVADGVKETSVDDVPDDLLEQILLRLDFPIFLIRAASTCKRWRGVIVSGDNGGAFLHRARSLHPPTVAGHYHTPGHWNSPIEFIPTWSPVLPIADSRFSLGEFSQWQVSDVHAGLVLLRQCDDQNSRFLAPQRRVPARRRRRQHLRIKLQGALQIL